MITSDQIKHLSSATLRDPDELAQMENEIGTIECGDDRAELLYYLAGRLTLEGCLDSAERVARAMEEWIIEKTWLLGDIAVKRWQLGQAEQALRLLHEAVPVAQSSGVEWQRAESLTKLAQRFEAVGQRRMAVELLSEAAEIAQRGETQCDIEGKTQDAFDSASTLDEIATILAKVGEWEMARKVAASIGNNYIRNRSLSRGQARPSEIPYAG